MLWAIIIFILWVIWVVFFEKIGGLSHREWDELELPYEDRTPQRYAKWKRLQDTQSKPNTTEPIPTYIWWYIGGWLLLLIVGVIEKVDLTN